MVISHSYIVPGADTAEQGTLVYDNLRAALANGDSVTVSFEGINVSTSSFVAAAFLPLLEQHDFDEVKRRMRVINSTRQINQLIKISSGTRSSHSGLILRIARVARSVLCLSQAPKLDHALVREFAPLAHSSLL